ncbi:MAG: porphobilinogen synthase [Candidatus Omnitrophota bacterium]
MRYPIYRPRRLRKNADLRRMIRQTRITPDNLIMPVFVRPGRNVRKSISSMPGNFQLSVDNLIKEARQIKDLGIPAILLFGIPKKKDELASEAYAKSGIVQQAVSRIKKNVPGLAVITDVCVCEYTSHGHCGIIRKVSGLKSRAGGYEIDNDATLELLAKTALSHARAGADMVAPSAMMDGQVKAIREALDNNRYENLPIMAYSAKYASSFYGPFREAAESPPRFGNRRSYQMDMANTDEALREVRLDLQEGADIVMVKPALAYLDIIRRVKERFNIPLAAYNVSGEFAMVKAAASRGWLEEKKIILEILNSIKRAGADIIITYHAKEVASWLREG